MDTETELRRQVDRLFRPAALATRGTPPRVGLELELFVIDPNAARQHPVSIDRVRRALATDPGLVEAGCVSFEPGGQLELSPAPRASVTALICDVAALVERLGVALARNGLAVVAEGVDRWRTVDDLGQQVEKDRYVVMQRHFDATGPAGRRMMRQTASLQICVDMLPGRAGRREWLAANLVGPALAAALRSSPIADNRTAIWLEVDPSRTGFDGTQIDDRDLAGTYASFALDAEAMPLPRRGDPSPLPFRWTFSDWAMTRDARPDAVDVAHHLSTLFPPVRPRGYLEIRYLDSQDIARLGGATALVAVLCADEPARECAIEIAGEPSRLIASWRASANLGLADPVLRQQALDLFEVGATRAAAVARRWPGWLPADTAATLGSLADVVRAAPHGAPQ